MKSEFIEKLINRLDRIDSGSLQTHFLRLASEKGLLETIFHAIREGILVLDGEGCISYANRAAEKLLGFTLERAEGTPIHRFLGDVDWNLVLKLDEQEWSRLVSREIEITYPEHRFLDFYLVPLSVMEAQERGAVVILRDVSREREHAATTLESERLSAITLLAAGVAHEIGNPLNSLNIHLQLLSRELRTLPKEQSAELADLVEVASGEVERLDRIIHQFLGAIRPQAPQLESSNLRRLVDDTLEVLKQEIANRGVWVEVESEADLPPVQADPGQVRQAFFNIIKNAVEAMASGGLLKITLDASSRHVGVAFRDSGPGIDPDNLSTVFEPYHTTKKNGTGLGLMIVQRIMREHGGEISIVSEPGAGTTITLFFPLSGQRIRLLKAHRPPAQEVLP